MTKFFNIYLKLITILLCQQVLTINAAKTRIIGGKPTTIDEQKYTVSLRTPTGRTFCGGSLVDKNYVVTAAHCVRNMTASKVNVHGGVTYLDQVGEKRSVEKISIPKAYNNETKTMDVAVLKLSTPMEGPNVATIGLCGHTLFAGDSVIISGWGRTNETIKDLSNQLRTTTVRMLSTAECKSKFKYTQLSNTMMCASVPGARDACVGDSGGPLVHNGELCGIISWGIGCAYKDYPGIYTNVNRMSVKKFLSRSMMN